MHDFKKNPELKNSQMDFYYFDSPHQQIFETFDATIVNVHDGDTVRVKTDFRNFTFPIRMLDIAAPELNEEGGITSRNWLSERINGSDVTIEIEPRNRVGKWGRLLGRIILDGLDLGEMSMNEGMSVPFESRKDGVITEVNLESGF